MVHVGVVLATDFLKDSGLPMTGRGQVIVDEVRMTLSRKTQMIT